MKVRGFHQGQVYQSVTPAEGRIYVSNRFSASRSSLAPRLGPYMLRTSPSAHRRKDRTAYFDSLHGRAVTPRSELPRWRLQSLWVRTSAGHLWPRTRSATKASPTLRRWRIWTGTITPVRPSQCPRRHGDYYIDMTTVAACCENHKADENEGGD